MTGADEMSALTQSIGEHAVQAIGDKHLSELSVSLSAIDMTARISVLLKSNTDREQERALEKLFDVQDLFFEEVYMTFLFGVDADMPQVHAVQSAQFSFA